MYTSGNYKTTAVIYGGITAFCVVLFIVYDRFSHNVRSPYMTFLFAIPLVLGVLPFAVLSIMKKHNVQEKYTVNARLSFNMYNAGIAALTVSSMLKGIFEIAGTGSPFQSYLTVFGLVLSASGVAAFLLNIRYRR